MEEAGLGRMALNAREVERAGMGKWQAGDPVSRTEDRLEGDPGITGATITAKIDSAFTSAATGSHTSVAERLSRNTHSGMGSTMVKKSAREKLWKRRKVEKSKATFPLCLERKRGHF